MEVVKYFKHLTGLDPTKDQTKLLKSLTNPKDDRIEIAAGRQSGKTLTVAAGVMFLAYEFNIPLRILLISAQENVVYWYIKGFFQEHKEELIDSLVGRSSTYVVSAKGFQLTRGTHVFVTGTTERNVRGIPADVVIIDEAYLVPNDSILTALGNLSGPVSKFILLSTPGEDKKALFMKWLTTGKFKVFHWSSVGLPWHSKALMDTKREEFTPSKWATDVLGRAPNDEELALSGKIFGKVIISKPLLN